jgi:tetratricopeptide repeat protein 8
LKPPPSPTFHTLVTSTPLPPRPCLTPWQAAWLLKCRALTERAYVDELEWEEGGVDSLLDDHAVASAPRPGTSVLRGGGGGGSVGTSASTSASAAAYRPMTASGRPSTGFARAGTSLGGGGGNGGRVGTSSMDAALRSSGRAGTSRAMTSMGRAVRLGTASLASAPGGAFIDSARLDLRKYAARPPLAKALANYLLHVEHNPKRALELAALATEAANYVDWWWKAVLGYAYYALGLMGEAERQFNSALRGAPWHVGLRLHAGRVSLRLDQPQAAMRVFGGGLGGLDVGATEVSATAATTTAAGAASAAAAASATQGGGGRGGDVSLLLAAARLHEAMGAAEAASALRRRALTSDASCVEATACLAASAFYGDQPEVALRLYRRLLLVAGTAAAPCELWVNLGLATFYAGQYDLSMPCFERALGTADGDPALADVWYNVGAVAVAVGDFSLALQAFTVACSAEPNHAEALTNLGVLEARKGNGDAARAHYASAQRCGGEWLYEPWYNGALLAWRQGDVAGAFAQATRALEIFPAHTDSKDLVAQCKAAVLSGNLDVC